MADKAKTKLGQPRQVRFPQDMEMEIQALADANHLEWVDAVRLVARFGLPIVKKKIGGTLKQAA